MILEIETPAGEDFSFLESISLFISAEGLNETKIAWKDPVPDPVGGKIDLDVSGEDLQEYIKKESFSLRISTTTDELLSEDHVIKVTCNFFVDAKLINN